MRKNIMTLDQLAEYCEKNKLVRFNAHEEKRSIVAQTFGQIEFDKDDESDLIPVVCKAYHTLENRNRSNIPKDATKNCLHTIINKPILAEIVEHEIDRGVDENGNAYVKTIKDFGSHAMDYYQDSNGDWKVKYIEQPVGIIPESAKPKIRHDKELMKDYVYANGYIYRHYGNETYEIMKRRGGSVSCSVEIEVKDFDYTDGILNINDYSVMGITLLGENVQPGMQGAKIDLANNHENFELTYSDQLEELNEKLNSILAKFEIDETARKEENAMDIENIQETSEVMEVAEVENETIEPEVNENVEVQEAEDTPEVVEVESTEDETVEQTEEVEMEEENKAESAEEEIIVEEAETVEDPVTEEPEVNEVQEVEEINEFEEAYNQLKGEFEEYKNTHSHTNEEYDALQTYHDNSENEKLHAQRESVLNNEKFSMLNDCEEFKKLRANMDNYSLTDLEREAKIIKADYVDVAMFANNNAEIKTYGTIFMTNSHSVQSDKKQPYGGIFEDFK